MNKLTRDKRIQVITALCEGVSMRAAGRLAGVSYNTVVSLLAAAGPACAEFHDKTVRDVHAKRVQCDEIWSFCYAKQRNVETAKSAPEDAGDLWAWIGLDADNKLIISYLVGDRSGVASLEFMQDMAGRLAGRVQLTSDGLRAYVEAVEAAFGADVDFAQLVKAYGEAPHLPGRYSPAECVGATKEIITGKPDPKHISTSFVERQNLNFRMGMRRYTRLTNAFSKSAEAHYNMMALTTVRFAEVIGAGGR